MLSLRGKRLALLALVPLALCVAPAGAAAPGSGIGLGDGRIGDFQWVVAAKRPDGASGSGRQGARQPCVLVGTTWHIGPFSYRRSKSRQCADPSGLTASAPPLIARGVQPSAGAPVKITAVGMLLAPAVHRLRVTFADGGTKTIHPDRLTPAEAHRAGLERFRYVAFAARGEWCAERMVTENASGRVLWDSGSDGYACGTSSGPPRFAG